MQLEVNITKNDETSHSDHVRIETRGECSFNLNDIIAVKLTPMGKSMLEDNTGLRPHLRPTKDGWYEGVFWEVMAFFGPKLRSVIPAEKYLPIMTEAVLIREDVEMLGAG